MFNIRHSSTRVAIERAFGLLKSKFRRLQYLDMRLIEKIPRVISAAYALHNFILVTENLDLEAELLDINLEQHDVEENIVHEQNVPRAVLAAAHEKRNELANSLA